MAQKFITPITVKQLASAGSDAVTVYVDADTEARLKIEAGGRLTWGSGSVTGDVNLYRDSADVLKTDDTLKVPTLFVDSIEVDTTGATTNQVLKFNGTKFAPGTASTVGSIDDLSDVVVTSPASGDVLKYNGSLWTSASVSGAGLVISATAPAVTDVLWADTSVTGVGVVPVGGTTGQFLSKSSSANYDAAWATIPSVSILDDVGDVAITSASSGQVLQWNGSAWINATVSSDIMTDTRNAALILMDIGV